MLIELSEVYNQPHRYYHTLVHIGEMFYTAKQFNLHLSPAQTIAIWFHDFVYDPKEPQQGMNEDRSIREMWRLMSPLVDNDILGEAGAIIEETIKHISTFPASALVQDLDLAILAMPRPRYEVYMKSVRKEYEHVPDEQFNEGRVKILFDLYHRAKQRRLYRSETDIPVSCHPKALENLRWELGQRI